MTAFCRNFCWECDQCKAARAELIREESAFQAIDTAKNIVSCGIFHQSAEERAALDHAGRP